VNREPVSNRWAEWLSPLPWCTVLGVSEPPAECRVASSSEFGALLTYGVCCIYSIKYLITNRHRKIKQIFKEYVIEIMPMMIELNWKNSVIQKRGNVFEQNQIRL